MTGVGTSINSSRLLERTFNVLLSLSVLSWAVLGIVQAEPAHRLTVVRLGITALNGVIGILFLVRRPLVRPGPPLALAAAVPSFLIGGVSYRFSAPVDQWSLAAEVVFACGVLITIISLVTLGRSFAVLPAVRQTVISGPYRMIRHPVYFGESLLVLACFSSRPTWQLAWLPPLFAATLALRILLEERVLSSDPAYRRYAQRVTWRLLPWIW